MYISPTEKEKGSKEKEKENNDKENRRELGDDDDVTHLILSTRKINRKLVHWWRWEDYLEIYRRESSKKEARRISYERDRKGRGREIWKVRETIVPEIVAPHNQFSGSRSEKPDRKRHSQLLSSPSISNSL